MVGRDIARRRIIAVSALLFSAGVVAFGVVVQPKHYWPFVIAAALGALLAFAELVSRYRDDPAGAVFSWPAGVYVWVNEAAAVAALYLIHVFGWNFGANGSAREAIQVLTAGLGSAALFRTSLFNVAAGDRVIGIGPSEILNVILAAADRAVDRQRALIRATRAGEIMQGLSFKDNAEALLKYCVATMQNVTPDEVKTVEGQISALRDPKNDAIRDTIKSYILGLSLLTLVGEQVLARASDQLKAALQGEVAPSIPGGPEPSPSPAKPSDKEDKVLQALRQAGAAIPLQELRKQVGLELDESFLIDDLRQRGLVILHGEEGNETIQITGTA